MRFAPRRHTLAAALALTSVLALATGCNDDDSGQGAPDGSASPDETQDAAPDAPPDERPDAAYRSDLTITFADRPDGSPPPSP